MLSTKIKEATLQSHQNLEGKVVRRLKAIRNNVEYAEILKCFYAYFSALENTCQPFVNEALLPGFDTRRTSKFLAEDILALGSIYRRFHKFILPTIDNVPAAFGALYVMEGSIMGGPHIVQLLRRADIDKGFTFFDGYGAETGKRWCIFTASLNQSAPTEREERSAIQAAEQTFASFAKTFSDAYIA